MKYGGWHSADVGRMDKDNILVELFTCSEDREDCKCVTKGEEMTDYIAMAIGLPLE